MGQIEKVKSEPRVQNGELHLTLDFNVHGYRSLSIPGTHGSTMGMCYVPVNALPPVLDGWMKVNPRVPSRTAKGLLSGPVAKGILETLRESPSSMVLKNQGIYMLTEKATYDPATERLRLLLTDRGMHGIVNGGHTYAAIREALEDEETDLSQAYVRLHVLESIEPEMVAEIAEGLNRSRQVDDPSLMNLQGEFDVLRKVLRGTKAEKSVAYSQGAEGDVYISEVLVYLSMLDVQRFTESRHPAGLYNRASLGIRYFAQDMELRRPSTLERIKLLPDILWLVDNIRKSTPEAARRGGFKFGMAKVASGERLGGYKQRGMQLPFIGEQLDYRVPNGWTYPMLAAFRANVKVGPKNALSWRMPLAKLLPAVIDQLVSVCVSEHKASGGRPELMGKREAAYAACYTKVELYLARARA